MKVAITLNTSWNIYNFRLGLIRALIAERHEVLAIAPKDNHSIKLQEAGCTFIPITMDNTGSNPFKDFSLFRQLRKIYQTNQPDIIFHFTVKPNIYGTLAAKTLNIPVINNVSGLGTVFLSNNLTSIVAKRLYRLAFSYTQLVFFQNKNDRESFLSSVHLPNIKTDLLPGSGINLSNFSSTAFNPTDEKIFLMIARLIKDKGVMEFIEASSLLAKKTDKVRFQILGKLDPDHARRISEETIKKAVQAGVIEYLGETDNVKPYIQGATCVVLPSYREGTPRTMLEAAAMARPVVTSDVPGCREAVIDKKSGFLCEPKNSSDLAQKMMSICELSNEELEIMGSNGRALVEKKFDEQIVIKKYLKHASNIINQIST